MAKPKPFLERPPIDSSSRIWLGFGVLASAEINLLMVVAMLKAQTINPKWRYLHTGFPVKAYIIDECFQGISPTSRYCEL